MSKKYLISLLLLMFYLTVVTNCTKEDNELAKKSKDALITSFELGTYKGKLNGTSLLIEVPYGTDISSLWAKVELSAKATIKPDPKTVKDWRNPVSFTVTAENGNSNKYTVKVKILPPVLTFEKLTKEYTKGGHLNATEILNHVNGEKAGYTLKGITNLNPNDIVKVNGSAPNLRLAFNQVGVFTASLHLKHNATSDLDVTLSNAAFEITKGDAPSDLSWSKQSKVYGLGGEISNGELLAGLNGTKTGYTLKSVTISNAGGTGARVSGSGTAVKIVGYTQAGTLTLNLVFAHATKADKTITGAQFEITEGLTWLKQSKVYRFGGEISNAELLGGLRGPKEGYRIKLVAITDDSSISGARVSGSGTSAKIVGYGKPTILTLVLVLEHATKGEKTITGAQFEIRKMSAPVDLTWRKQSKPYRSGEHISNAELLRGLSGTKTGYTVKSVTISDAGGTGAKVSGSGTSAKIVGYTGAGTLTLTLVFAHATRADKTISGAQFELTSVGSSVPLSWRKQIKVYRSGGEISNGELLGGLRGPKEGYRIKSLQITGDSSISGARVSGSGTAAKIVGYGKATILTLTLVLEHDTEEDKTLSNAVFEITKMVAPTDLRWIKQLKRYRSGQEISNAELLRGLEGSKVGYRIKSVAITDDSGDSGARVSGMGTAAKIVSYGKPTILTLTLVFAHDTKADKTITGAQFELTIGVVSVPLSWSRQSKVYSLAGEISNSALLGGVRGTKDGYRIKTVQITGDSSSSGARVSGSGTAAKIVSYGKATILTLTLVLEHDTKAEKTLSNAVFEIRKMPVPVDLSWRKQSKVYSAGGEISNGELLRGLSGTKTGYRVKTVSISDSGGTGARVSGNGTSAKIVGYTKAGTLTLSIVFENDTKEDKNITGAEFEIAKASAPHLTWTKQAKPFSSSGEITSADLLAGVRGSDKTGYTIKTVTITNKNGTGARVSGIGRAAKITGYTKAGTLTLTLVLVHDTKDDVTLSNAQFEITKASAPRLTWIKQTKPFSSGGEITSANLLAGVTGSGKNGYTIKTITITNKNGTGASVLGSGRAAKITGYTKTGTLTLTLVLAHDTKKDVTITGAKFEITKASAASLTWSKQTKRFSSAGEITSADLFAGVRGSDKTGYTLKTVIITSKNGTGASVLGSGRAAKITGYTKAGTLTLTLVLVHNIKEDVTLSNAQFEIAKASAARLTWRKQSKPFSSIGEITHADLFAGVTGTSSDKNGYTIKTVRITNHGGMTSARVSWNGTSAKITGYTKAGTFTLTLLLVHDTKADVTLSGAQFEITKTSAARLTWRKQSKPFNIGEITHAELLVGVQGSKTGYTIKTVNITNNGGMTSARVSGNGTSAKITGYTRVGTFTLTLVLVHDTKKDVTITGAQFEITRGRAARLTWTKQSKPFSRGGEITNDELLAGVTGSGKTGYTIKTVTMSNDGGTGARVSGSGRTAKITSYRRTGTLTLTLVLAHPAKADATISNAQFDIYRDIFTISSSGEVKLKSYVDKNTLIVVTIPNSIGGTIVTSIGRQAFKDCRKLLRITLSNSLTSIGEEAFYLCSALTRITMGNSVTSIGNLAFYRCIALTSITLSNSVTSIGQYAFEDCRSLTSITIPDKVKSIESGTFSGCIALTSITIPNSVTSIGSGAFSSCTATRITIPNSVTSIGSHVFRYCSALTRITLSNSLTSIGQYAFEDCRSLTRITLPNSLTSIGQYAFASRSYRVDGDSGYSSFTSITMGNSVTSIGYRAFYGCAKLTSMTIPNSVTSIGDYAFLGCRAFTRITIPNSVTSIGDYAFLDCRSLTSITIPNSVTSIGSSTFARCRSLTSITLSNSLTSIEGSTFSGCSALTRIIIPNTVTSIGWGTFYKCTSLTSITLSNSLTSIGGSAFGGCSALTRITIPTSVTSIGSGAFSDCRSLTSITIPNSVKSIESATFSGCSALTRITIPNSVTSIGGSAFRDCSALTSITIPNSVASIGELSSGGSIGATFRGCSALISITIPDKVKSIEQGTFHGCSALTSITIPTSVTSIKREAFRGCSALTRIAIPDYVTSIENEVFYECTSLTSITFPDYITSIKDGAFYKCSALTNIAIPDYVTSIGASAFEHCSKLTSVTIPTSVTSIGNLIFKHCISLVTIKLPNSITTIGSEPFKHCTKLTTISVPKAKVPYWQKNLTSGNAASVVGY